MTALTSTSSRRVNFIIHELKNISTEMNLVDETKSIEILQCEVSSITFQVKNNSGLVGQLISIKGAFQVGKEPDIQFAAIGRVSEVKSVSDTEQHVTIKMNQYDTATWGRIIERIGLKQRRVDNLFQAMKGED